MEGMRIKTTSEMYKIPISSLRDPLYGVTRGCKRKIVLNSEKAWQIVLWICRLQEMDHGACHHPINVANKDGKDNQVCQGQGLLSLKEFRDKVGRDGGRVGIENSLSMRRKGWRHL